MRTTLPDGQPAVRFQASDIYGWFSLPWTGNFVGTWLYRLYGLDGDLLYIGISGTLGTRLDHHRAKKPWWPEVDHAIVTFIGPERLALATEVDAIRAEMPRYNIRSKPGVQPKAAA